MKVRCITRENLSPHAPTEDGPEPEVGDIITVTSIKECHGVPCYQFAEYGTWWFDQQNFAPIGDADETERLEAWQDEQDSVLEKEMRQIIREMEGVV